jgi:hypothetical protein
MHNPEFTDEYFLKIHFYVEGILKRLMLFGLRKLGLQYRTAINFIKKYNSHTIENLIDDTFRLLKIDPKIINGVSKFSELKNYVIEFSSKYRNLRVHGIYDKISDSNLLQALIGCDYYFIRKLEIILKKANIPSFYEKPSAWVEIKRGKFNNISQLNGVNLSGQIQEQKMKYSAENVLETLLYVQSKSKEDIPLTIKKRNKS